MTEMESPLGVAADAEGGIRLWRRTGGGRRPSQPLWYTRAPTERRNEVKSGPTGLGGGVIVTGASRLPRGK